MVDIINLLCYAMTSVMFSLCDIPVVFQYYIALIEAVCQYLTHALIVE